MLQKQEQKQFQDLNAKELQLREHQDKRSVLGAGLLIILYCGYSVILGFECYRTTIINAKIGLLIKYIES